MDYQRLASSSDPTQCCGLFAKRGETVRDLAAQPVHVVLERMEKLQRALHMKSMSVWNHQCEEQRDAVRARIAGDVEGARSHMRVALRLRYERSTLLKKYENVASLTSKLQSVYENAAMASAISSANVQLDVLLNQHNYADLMDELRDNLDRAHEQDTILSEDVDVGMDVDDELDALIVQQEDEEAAEMETRLPDAPRVPLVHQEKQKVREGLK